MKVNKVSIDSEYIKLDNLLKFSGAVVTGGEAKLAIKDGRVFVNGIVCTARGKKLRHGDTVEFDEVIYEVEQSGGGE